jgi:aspartokinase/homoserine dehydrogenase 1
MKILKFGGSSVGTPERIRDVLKIASARKEKVAVVVSAFQGITDELIATATLAAKGDASYNNRTKQIQQRHVAAAKELVANRERDCIFPDR